MDSDADFSAILPWFLEMIPFNVQTKNRNRVGGVRKTPYESIPSNCYFRSRSLSQQKTPGNQVFYLLPGIVLFFNGFLFLPRVHFPGGDEGIHQFRDLGG